MSLLSRRVDAVVVPTVDQDDAGDANQAADQLEESWSLAEPHQERLTPLSVAPMMQKNQLVVTSFIGRNAT